MSEKENSAAGENPPEPRGKSDPKPGAPDSKAAPSEPQRRGGSGALAVALLALLAAGGVGTGGWYLWQELQALQGRATELARSDRETAAALTDLRRNQQQAGAAAGELATRLGETRAELDDARRMIDALSGRLAEARGDWNVAEVEYLLRIAERAALMRDVGSAIAVLRAADDRLQAVGDNRLHPVREQIAAELHALRTANLPDVEGISAELAAISGQLQELPLATAERQSVEQAADQPAETDGWRSALERIGNDLRGLVTIRRGEAPAALTTPERRFFLRQNLQLKLETARLALLEKRQMLYRDSLAESADWVRRYYPPDHSGVAATLQRIQALQAVDIAPELPRLGAALQTLRRIAPEIEAPAGEAS